jgi:hypothetical protein
MMRTCATASFSASLAPATTRTRAAPRRKTHPVHRGGVTCPAAPAPRAHPLPPLHSLTVSVILALGDCACGTTLNGTATTSAFVGIGRSWVVTTRTRLARIPGCLPPFLARSAGHWTWRP